MTTRTVDFDAFRAEQKHEPVEFKIGGVVYDLPPALPAAIAVDAIRLQQTIGNDGEVPMDALDSIGKAIFGAALWQTLLEDHRITVKELPELITQVLGVYSGEADPKGTASTSRGRKSTSA